MKRIITPIGNYLNTNNKIPARLVSQKYATYRTDDAKASITTFEQSQNNPILKNNANKAYQHPPYVRSICDLPNCQDKLCKTPCGKIVEDADVGHATHSPTFPNVKYISATDCSGQNKTEYMVSYNPPIENTTAGQNINKDKTANLNNNKEALENIHLNSSRNPAKKAFTGSDDPTNIN